jgi:hypothetical protein
MNAKTVTNRLALDSQSTAAMFYCFRLTREKYFIAFFCETLENAIKPASVLLFWSGSRPCIKACIMRIMDGGEANKSSSSYYASFTPIVTTTIHFSATL